MEASIGAASIARQVVDRQRYHTLRDLPRGLKSSVGHTSFGLRPLLPVSLGLPVGLERAPRFKLHHKNQCTQWLLQVSPRLTLIRKVRKIPLARNPSVY